MKHRQLVRLRSRAVLVGAALCLASASTAAGVLALQPAENVEIGSLATGATGVRLSAPGAGLTAFGSEPLTGITTGSTVARHVKMTSLATADQDVSFQLLGGAALGAGLPEMKVERCSDSGCVKSEPVGEKMPLKARGEATVRVVLRFTEPIPAKAVDTEVADIRLRARVGSAQSSTGIMGVNPLRFAPVAPKPSESGRPTPRKPSLPSSSATPVPPPSGAVPPSRRTG